MLTAQPLRAPVLKPSQQHASTSGPQDTNLLCQRCNQNLHLIVQLLSEYDPPDDEYFLLSADSYRQSLHRRYPICGKCESGVQERLGQVDKQLCRRRVLESLQQSHAEREGSPSAGGRHGRKQTLRIGWGSIRRLFGLGVKDSRKPRHRNVYRVLITLITMAEWILLTVMFLFHVLGILYPKTFVPPTLVTSSFALLVRHAECKLQVPLRFACFTAMTARLSPILWMMIPVSMLKHCIIQSRSLSETCRFAIFILDAGMLFIVGNDPMSAKVDVTLLCFAWHLSVLFIAGAVILIHQPPDGGDTRPILLWPSFSTHYAKSTISNNQQNEQEDGVLLAFQSISLGEDVAYRAFVRSKARQQTLLTWTCVGLLLHGLLDIFGAEKDHMSERGGEKWMMMVHGVLGFTLMCALVMILRFERARPILHPIRMFLLTVCLLVVFGQVVLSRIWLLLEGQSMLLPKMGTWILIPSVVSLLLLHSLSDHSRTGEGNESSIAH